MRRSPLLRPTPGALSGPRCLEGCREIVLHLIVRFVRFLTPAGPSDTRGFDVVTTAVALIIGLASNDTSNATETKQQDPQVPSASDIFSLS